MTATRTWAPRFAIAGVRAEHTIAHCLNYALYAGGIAGHMALEASGATVVPVGVGQSRRLLELIPPYQSTRSSARSPSPPISPAAPKRPASNRGRSASGGSSAVRRSGEQASSREATAEQSEDAPAIAAKVQ